MQTLIHNAAIVNEGRIFCGSVAIEGERIVAIYEAGTEPAAAEGCHVVEADGMLLLPGVIDTHVHFRDGGLSDNPAGTFATESRAARAGGVTSVIDMPNTNPPTISLEALERKEAMAERSSVVNYGFMLGATNKNIDELLQVEPTRYAAIKVFLGSSTGNLLVDNDDSLDRLFSQARKLIVAHCEDEFMVQTNIKNYRQQFQGTPDENAALHPRIRNNMECAVATYRAISRARRFGTRLHIAHITTTTELNMLSNFDLDNKSITAEVTPNHLFFDERDYAALGNLIKCNPAIKSPDDRLALWAGLSDDLIDTIATDHAPHPLQAKQKPYFDAPSGIPSIQHSLQMMLESVFGSEANAWQGLGSQQLAEHLAKPEADAVPIGMIVQKMCHNPARLFGIEGRGFIREGQQADLVLVRPGVQHTVQHSDLLYRCEWSPIEGQTFHTRIECVWVNGCADESTTAAQALRFTK